uniref:Uncharacterized protein n=1 Tax=Oryza sativa subsp. japonica TaxID=39947 RepID=Q2QUT4_ORYSJ|nr:hypothetical protein LOC_Os12g15170 [Oryza sativa Japonica Group]
MDRRKPRQQVVLASHDAESSPGSGAPSLPPQGAPLRSVCGPCVRPPPSIPPWMCLLVEWLAQGRRDDNDLTILLTHLLMRKTHTGLGDLLNSSIDPKSCSWVQRRAN